MCFQGHSVFFNSCVEFSAAISGKSERNKAIKKKNQIEMATTIFFFAKCDDKQTEKVKR